MSVNKVILIGRLGADPELKNGASGTPVCRFSVATNETFRHKSGEQEKHTEWHSVVCFGRLAEVSGELLGKSKLLSEAFDNSRYREHLFIASNLPVGIGQSKTGKISFT